MENIPVSTNGGQMFLPGGIDRWWNFWGQSCISMQMHIISIKWLAELCQKSYHYPAMGTATSHSETAYLHSVLTLAALLPSPDACQLQYPHFSSDMSVQPACPMCNWDVCAPHLQATARIPPQKWSSFRYPLIYSGYSEGTQNRISIANVNS